MEMGIRNERTRAPGYLGVVDTMNKIKRRKLNHLNEEKSHTWYAVSSEEGALPKGACVKINRERSVVAFFWQSLIGTRQADRLLHDPCS